MFVCTWFGQYRTPESYISCQPDCSTSKNQIRSLEEEQIFCSAWDVWQMNQFRDFMQKRPFSLMLLVASAVNYRLFIDLLLFFFLRLLFRVEQTYFRQKLFAYVNWHWAGLCYKSSCVWISRRSFWVPVLREVINTVFTSLLFRIEHYFIVS